jgi:hypothetical protein
MAQTNEEDTDWHYAPPTTDKLDAGCLYMSRYRRTVAVRYRYRYECVYVLYVRIVISKTSRRLRVLCYMYRHCRAVVTESQNYVPYSPTTFE